MYILLSHKTYSSTMYDEEAINRCYEQRFTLRTLKLLKAYSASKAWKQENGQNVTSNIYAILTNMWYSRSNNTKKSITKHTCALCCNIDMHVINKTLFKRRVCKIVSRYHGIVLLFFSGVSPIFPSLIGSFLRTITA